MRTTGPKDRLAVAPTKGLQCGWQSELLLWQSQLLRLLLLLLLLLLLCCHSDGPRVLRGRTQRYDARPIDSSCIGHYRLLRPSFCHLQKSNAGPRLAYASVGSGATEVGPNGMPCCGLVLHRRQRVVLSKLLR